MKQRPRRYFTQTEMAEVFDRQKLLIETKTNSEFS